MSLCLTEVNDEKELKDDVLLSHIIVNDIHHSLKKHRFTEINEMNHDMK